MSPERHTCLMPCARKNGVFTLRAIYCEEVQRLMIGICQTYRHYNMSGTDIGKTSKRLLNPELLKLYLATAFLLLLKLNGFLGLIFNGRTRAAMLKLNLCTKGPTLSEVIAKINHGMRNIETSMTWIVLSAACRTIAVARVAIEVAAHCHFAISAYAKTIAFGVLHHAVGCYCLCL